jgi:hypothetical protein
LIGFVPVSTLATYLAAYHTVLIQLQKVRDNEVGCAGISSSSIRSALIASPMGE